MDNLEFKVIESLEELLTNYQLIKELLPSSSIATMESSYPTLVTQGVKFFTLAKDGSVVGLVQYTVTTNLENTKQIQLNEIVVDRDNQNEGLGKLMLDYLKELAVNNDCKVIYLGTNIANGKAQKFYFSNGFKIGAFSMYKTL